MNHLILLPEEEQTKGIFKVTGPRAKYLTENHNYLQKKEKSEDYSILIYNKNVGKAKLISYKSGEFQFEYKIDDEKSLIFDEESNKHLVTLICGIGRPHSLKKILQFAAMFRIKTILFVPSELAEKSYLTSNLFKGDAIRDELIKGLEQIGYPFAPEVKKLNSFDELNNFFPNNYLKILAEPKAQLKIKNIVLEDHKIRDLSLAIGTESGWSKKEREKFKNIGFKEAKLSDDHYRIEVAFAAIMGAIIS